MPRKTLDSKASNEALLAPDVREIANDLRPILLKLSRFLRRELYGLDLGITAVHASVLSVISHRPGIGVAELAEIEGVSRPRMSLVVQKLVERDLVMSERGSDRRRVGLQVTPKGSSVLKSARRRRTTWLASRLDALDADELHMLSAAAPALAKLVDEP